MSTNVENVTRNDAILVDCIRDAVIVAYEHAQTGSEDNLVWVIDQMLRKLFIGINAVTTKSDDELEIYRNWVKLWEQNHTHYWDVGLKP